MLKWQGDFTLPRLRAKLASKYLLHPDVEPEYAEVYRPELCQSVVSRKDFLPGPNPGVPRTTLASTFNTTRNLDLTKAAATPKEVPYSQRTPKRAISVPSLGVKRAVVAPAGFEPVPPNLQFAADVTLKLQLTRSAMPSHAEPVQRPADVNELRAFDKERQVELASRRFWTAAHGNQHFLQEEVEQVKLESGGTISNQEILSRLKTTQVCNQMNKARREGAQIDWRNKEWDGATLLLRAARTGSMALAMHLIAIGADPMVLDDSGRGLLHWVAVEGNTEMADFFLKSLPDLQANANLSDNGGDTPLHLAAYYGHLSVVRMLVHAGADPTQENAGGFTPVQLAEARKMSAVLQYLSNPRSQEEDKSSTDVKLNTLMRPCNIARAAEVNNLLKSGLLVWPKPTPIVAPKAKAKK